MTTAIRTLHVPKIPLVTGLDPIVQQFLRMADFTVISDPITYATTSGGTAFTVPRNVAILDIGLNVTTAWNGTAPKIQIGDGSTVDLYATYAPDVLGTVRAVKNAILKPNTTSTSLIVVTITLSGSTTGACTLWLTYRASTNMRGVSADKNSAY